jgi:xylulokinase
VNVDVVVAIDIGTTAAKSVLFDRDGVAVASATFDYATQTQGARVEQDPNDWWTATVAGLRSLRDQAPDAKPVAVVLSGHMQDVVLMGEAQALAPAIMYSDTRAQAESQIVRERLGEGPLRQVTGNLQDAASLLAKLLWLKRQEPALYEAAQNLLVGAHDYVAWRFCQVHAADYTTASTTGLLDLAANTWATGFLDALDLRTDWLPQLVAAEAQVGEVSATVAEETGLPVGAPIFHGAGDAATTTLGAGAGDPGRYYVYLGTSGWLAATERHMWVDPRTGIFNLRHPDPERLILIGPMLTAAGNVEWLREQFGRLEVGLERAPEGGAGLSLAAGPSEQATYDALNTLAAEAPAGSKGVLYLPYLAGERAPFRDPNARGVFLGLGRTTTRQDLYRAVMEGVAFSMRAIRDALPASQDPEGSELTLVGGGARSAVWSQIFADVFQSPVWVLASPGEVAARGAAVIAGRARGWYTGYVPAADFFPVEAAFQPDPAVAERYDRLYEVFGGLYPALRESFAHLAQTLRERDAQVYSEDSQ